jgi:xylulose-5-phosphate/fructose-6-phosphate phosphoketolase
MMLCNRTSRFDVAIAAIRGGAEFNPKIAISAHELESSIKHMAQKEREYIYKNGQGELTLFSRMRKTDRSVDHDYIFETPKFEGR